MHPVEEYLRSLREIHASGAGVAETSYYGSLEALLNQAGALLSPRVRCVINVRNQGAGLPDGGFFTRQQLRDDPKDLILQGQVPARGVMEVKGSGEDVAAVAASAQVKDQYWPRYGQVLVTNLRSFLLVATDPNGVFALLERFDLAPTEADFWAKVRDPHSFAASIGDQLLEFLARVLLRPSPLRDPSDVAWYLASYAREANARVAKADPALLQDVRAALEESLGIEFAGERGAHFFRSTLVQTLFYGVFSAWVLWARDAARRSTDTFDWRLAAWSLHVPMVEALYTQLNSPARLGALGVVQLLQWTGETLNRIERDEFFKRFEDGKAVQYFYEPFLEAFDPELRKELGVWYTPPEIVQYMVARVDHVLRTELHIPDGLADERVIVLDPCTGTGSFLIEVLATIGRTLRAKGDDALVPHDLKKAAQERVIGFELLPAPFVVAHLQLGLMLRREGAALGAGERASVYLTNSLTGWSEDASRAPRGLFPELEDEHDLAKDVKQDKHVIVVLGNPPYNAFAGASPKEEGDLVAPYKAGLREEWGIKKYNLDDLYIRFFRIAERRIAEQSGEGVVALISNFSYVDEASYVVMRKRFLDEFDSIWIDSLNGDSRRTGKRTPEGDPDPSVFSTKSNRAGITVGTAIGIMVKKPAQRGQAVPPVVRHRQFWGRNKKADLLASLKSPDIDSDYMPVEPMPINRYSLAPSPTNDDYESWPLVTDLAVDVYQGLSEDRRKALIDIDRERLEARMKVYFDENVEWNELVASGGPLTSNYVDFAAESMRQTLLSTKGAEFQESRIWPYLARPFDLQWCYYLPYQPLWRRPRAEFGAQVWKGNHFLLTRFAASGSDEGLVMAWTSSLCDYHSMMTSAVAIPRLLKGTTSSVQLAAFEAKPVRANLRDNVLEYLNSLGAGALPPEQQADLVWLHALAIGSSPRYLHDNADPISRDYPRIPLPGDPGVLAASAKLGRLVAALFDIEQEVVGITSGTAAPWVLPIGQVTKADGSPIEVQTDLLVKAAWGVLAKDNKVMPGRGIAIEREYTEKEREAIAKAAADQDLSGEEALERLGSKTFDVWLNKQVFWRNIPGNVWMHTVTRNQVLKKWLSYREEAVLGRPLSISETRQFTTTARRIAAVLLLGPALDNNYFASLSTQVPLPPNRTSGSLHVEVRTKPTPMVHVQRDSVAID